MRKAFIFHHNDHDGIVSGAIMLKWLMDNGININDVTAFSIDYNKSIGELLPEVQKDDIVIFVDYSFSTEINKNVFISYAKTTRNLIWIDHHKTSLSFVDQIVRIEENTGNKVATHLIDTRYSASMLCYFWASLLSLNNFNRYDLDDLIIDNLDILASTAKSDNKFIRYIDAWDIHDTSKGIDFFNNEILNFHRGLKLSSDIKDFYNDDKFELLASPSEIVTSFFGFIKVEIDMVVKTAVRDGRMLSEYIESQDKFQLASAFPFTIDGYNCIALNRKGPSTIFMEKYNEYDIVCPFMFDGVKWTYSLFSGNQTPCLPIAEHFGGGGHPYACGFTLDELILYKDCHISINE